MTVKAADQKRREFILNANMWKVIILISLPLIVYNAFNYLYGVIDAAIVANISKEAVSAVVVLDQIRTMLFAFGSGLASGGTILIARLIGRYEFEKAKTLANTMIIIAVAIALVTICIVIPAAPFILRLARVPQGLIAIGTGYFTIQIITVGVSLFNNVYLGFEKARGSTVSILVLNLFVIGIKIGLTILFVLVLDMGIVMTAAATLIANGLLTIYVLFHLVKKSYLFRFSFKNKDLSLKYLKPLFVLSVPIFLGRFVFSLGKVIINAMCEHYGETVVGALGISNSLGGSVTNILNSVEDSEGTVISQNVGNSNHRRAINAFYCTLALNLTMALIGVGILTVFNDPIMNYFSGGDAEFSAMISDIFKYEKIGIISLGINAAVLGLLYGYGYTRMTMTINLARLFVFRIPSLFFLMNFTSLGHESVGIAMLVSNGGIGIMSIAVGIIYLFKIKKNKFEDKLLKNEKTTIEEELYEQTKQNNNADKKESD